MTQTEPPRPVPDPRLGMGGCCTYGVSSGCCRRHRCVAVCGTLACHQSHCDGFGNLDEKISQQNLIFQHCIDQLGDVGKHLGSIYALQESILHMDACTLYMSLEENVFESNNRVIIM